MKSITSELPSRESLTLPAMREKAPASCPESGEELAGIRDMSSLRLVHSKNHPTPGEDLTGRAGESFEGSERSSSVRLQSIVEKVYRLENNDALQVFDQLIDDLLAEARGEAKPAGGGQ